MHTSTVMLFLQYYNLFTILNKPKPITRPCAILMESPVAKDIYLGILRY